MNDLVQVIPVLSAEEVKFVNSELDKKEFTVSTIGFDGVNGRPRVDSNIRSSSGVYLIDDEEVAQVIHKGMNSALWVYHDRLTKIHPIFDGSLYLSDERIQDSSLLVSCRKNEGFPSHWQV